MMNQLPLFLLLTLTKSQDLRPKWHVVGNPLAHARPCENNDKVLVTFEPGLPPGEENQYILNVVEDLPSFTKAQLKFDSEATVILSAPDRARISTINDEFYINFFKSSPNLNVKVKGPTNGTIPYIQSIVINGVEYCEKYKTGYLDNFIIGYKPTATVTNATPDSSCGRRKVDHTELIVNGDKTKPGDWPWHAALYRLDGANLNYICGGTLLSQTLIVTAAHCVTLRGVPILRETLNVVLGKFNLIGGDISTQEREVHEIIVNENYDFKVLNNDIALLKLKSEVIFNDYIQPACLWSANDYKQLNGGQILGTVVGWGFDQTDRLTSQLRQAVLPKISEVTCLKSNPVFFGKMLTSQKFCAGYRNGTSPCNGDSGGGYVVFIPDASNTSSSGSYHLRGIVSTSLARREVPICDPNNYVLFTDVAKFRGWISGYLD